MVSRKSVKILLMLACGVALVFSLNGCKKNGEQPPEGPTPTDTDVGTPPETTSTTTDVVKPDRPDPVTEGAADIVPGVGMGALTFGMSKEQIIAVLGEPDKMEGGGIALFYQSKGLTMLLDRRKGLHEINCWSSEHPMSLPDVATYKGKTEKGIGMGATREQIVAAYGAPNSAVTKLNMETLSYASLKASFGLFQNKVVNIKLRK
ncbi:MAG: hypothetical protein ACYTBJ_08205 [Planctomycetota bacterium]|jgi:hypothetical protein